MVDLQKTYQNTDDGCNHRVFCLKSSGHTGKHNTINCPAAHHIYEGRWLKDPKYVSEYINFWLENSGDGIRQYSFWVADATLAFKQHP